MDKDIFFASICNLKFVAAGSGGARLNYVGFV